METWWEVSQLIKTGSVTENFAIRETPPSAHQSRPSVFFTSVNLQVFHFALEQARIYIYLISLDIS